MQVDLEKCTGCGDCLDTCSNGAISLLAEKARIDLDICQECGACAPACPVGAISWAEMPVAVVTALDAPIVKREPTPFELAPSRKLAPWAETALAFMGREIVPRITDALIAALERRLTRPARSPVTITQPLAPRGRIISARARRRRRRAGWRAPLSYKNPISNGNK